MTPAIAFCVSALPIKSNAPPSAEIISAIKPILLSTGTRSAITTIFAAKNRLLSPFFIKPVQKPTTATISSKAAIARSTIVPVAMSRLFNITHLSDIIFAFIYISIYKIGKIVNCVRPFAQERNVIY